MNTKHFPAICLPTQHDNTLTNNRQLNTIHSAFIIMALTSHFLMTR